MNCKEIQTKIEIYLDRELTLSDRRDFEEHIDGCDNCLVMLESMRELNNSVKEVNYAKAPFSLRRKIKNDLKVITGEDGLIYSKFQLFRFGASCAALASIAVWTVMTYMLTLPMQTQLINELTEAHVRSLLVDHVTDITTSDSHTVKPWFSGKLDFSPVVIDLKEDGFQLIGGRLDYLQIDPSNNQAAAVLVYKRRSHHINLFIYRDNGVAQPPQMSGVQNRSYNLINWHKQGFKYWAISDLNSTELELFAQLLGSDDA